MASRLDTQLRRVAIATLLSLAGVLVAVLCVSKLALAAHTEAVQPLSHTTHTATCARRDIYPDNYGRPYSMGHHNVWHQLPSRARCHLPLTQRAQTALSYNFSHLSFLYLRACGNGAVACDPSSVSRVIGGIESAS